MFTVSFETSNAAFDDGIGGVLEITRLLRHIADEVEGGSFVAGSLRDINGNTVGSWSLDEGMAE
jgi:hypothetical protein